MDFRTRAYNDFNLNTQTRSSIIKSSDETRLKGETEYYLNLPDDLKIFFPRVLSHSSNKPYKLELEYYAYDNLGNAMFTQKKQIFWQKTFDFISNYIDSYKDSANKKQNLKDLDLMYITKTENEYSNLINNFTEFQKLKDFDIIYLNDEPLFSFETVWIKIKEKLRSINKTDFSYLIHGDLCFSNILYGEHSHTNDLILKFIDPRGVFGETLFYGDFYYDLAKLSHSVNGGYEYFIYDNFDISVNENKIRLNYKSANNKALINEVFNDFVEKNNFDIEKIKLLEGCIFVGMCARHYDDINRQFAMYVTGLKILNEYYKNI